MLCHHEVEAIGRWRGKDDKYMGDVLRCIVGHLLEESLLVDPILGELIPVHTPTSRIQDPTLSVLQ